MQLSGHKVLITGGSAGTGRELARQLVARGNTVAICGRDLGKLEQAAAELGDVKTLQADLSRPTDVPALATAAAERLGGLSVLVNNAGVQYNYSFDGTACHPAGI
jgi:short-subunit dehydrogenase involved in D-alanine esterification of teichoic acids